MRRVVVVTGASGGIGLATCKLLKNNGWYVVGVDKGSLSDSSAMDRFIKGDLSEEYAVEQFVKSLSDLGRINALVNNAGVQVNKVLVETTPQEYDYVMGVNVRMAYLLIRATYPLMRGEGGAIINVSSVHAIATSRSVAVYAASKGALVALTRAAALELADENIRVNAVLPGAVDTPMLREGLGRRMEEEGAETGMRLLRSKTPLRRVAEPEEIAQAILFLADGTRSGYMTGQTLVVDGGATARLSTE